MNMDNKFVDNLNRLMEIHGHSETYLGSLSGITQPTINRIRTGGHKSSKLETITSIAKVYGVTISQLVGETEIDWNKQKKEGADVETDNKTSVFKEGILNMVKALPEEKITEDLGIYIRNGVNATAEELKRNNTVTYVMQHSTTEYKLSIEKKENEQ